MGRLQLLLAAVLSITCCVYAQQQHTVFAMVVGKGEKKLPEIKVNGVKMNLHAPGAQEPGALVQGPPSGTATFIVGGKASENTPVMAEALVMPAASKPKTATEKALDDLNLTKEEKKKLFPCDDYQPWCKNYASTHQCRDVWSQKNCRKSCKLCAVPYGVFLGCNDLEVCKKFGESACMVRWVRETCKTKCGSCGYERQSNSHILMGKKRHFSSANTKQVKKIEPKQHDKAKQLQKVLKKITKKATDEVKQAAVHVKQQKKNDKPALKPKVVEKPLIKAKEIQSDDISDKNDDDDDDDDNDDKSDDDDDANDEDISGEGSSDVDEENHDHDHDHDHDDDDDDDDDDDNASGEDNTEDKHDEPIRLDTDPRGEPVVAKLVNQPIKFNDAPGKAMRVELVKEAKPTLVKEKKVAKKVNNDKVEKKGKQVKKEVQKNDKPKTKAIKPKKLKN